MRPPRLLLVLPLVAACHASSRPTPSGPLAPVRLTTGSPPRTVIRTAAAELTAAGFLVTAIDSSGRLRAEREHHPGEFDETVTCRSSAAAPRASVTPTMIIDLAAQPRDDGGSELEVASRVRASYLRLSAAPARATNDEDCRSTGLVEQDLVRRLGGHPR